LTWLDPSPFDTARNAGLLPVGSYVVEIVPAADSDRALRLLSEMDFRARTSEAWIAAGRAWAEKFRDLCLQFETHADFAFEDYLLQEECKREFFSVGMRRTSRNHAEMVIWSRNWIGTLIGMKHRHISGEILQVRVVKAVIKDRSNNE
jgi:hypothetical protein